MEASVKERKRAKRGGEAKDRRWRRNWQRRRHKTSIGEVASMFAFVGLTELIPLLVFAGFVFGVWSVLSLISNRNSRAQERLERISRPASLAEIEDPKNKKERFQNVMETAKALSGPLMPKTEGETSALRT